MAKAQSSSTIEIILFVCCVVGCAWIVTAAVAHSVSDYEVIQPKDGIECVVVSRMFNTSVDCWRALDE